MNKGPVTIATFDNDFAANIALTRLQAAGIRAILDNALMSEVWNIPGAAYTAINLLVNPGDADAARAILDDVTGTGSDVARPSRSREAAEHNADVRARPTS